MNTVTIYSTPTCHFCHLAKDFFLEHNVPFTDIDIAQDAEKRKYIVEKTGQLGVPVISIGDEYIVGFDKLRIASLLGISY